MLFPGQLSFELRSKMFSWREQVNIKGPGGLEWFSMLRASSAFAFSWNDTQVIGNLAGEPMLSLRSQFRMMHYEYRLERLGLDGLRIPLCVITRHWQLFAPATYEIQLLTPAFGGAITCQGRWFNDFVMYQAGAPACRIQKR